MLSIIYGYKHHINVQSPATQKAIKQTQPSAKEEEIEPDTQSNVHCLFKAKNSINDISYFLSVLCLGKMVKTILKSQFVILHMWKMYC